MDSMAALGTRIMPVNIEKRFLQTEGWANKLAKPAKDWELLIGMDKQSWMSWHIVSSQVEGDNLGLMQSVLGLACIMMGSARMTDHNDGTQGSEEGQAEKTSTPDKTLVKNRPQRRTR